MSNDPVLYTNPQSRGRIASWMLEETGAAYRTEWVDYGPAMHSEAFRARNPMGKVPVVVHGDQTVTECAAICLDLADAFPEAACAASRPARVRAEAIDNVRIKEQSA